MSARHRAKSQVSLEVTTPRSLYGFISLHMRNGALVGLTANTTAITQANAGQVQQDPWEVFSDVDLTSSRGTVQVNPPRRRPCAEEEHPDEDLWKGLEAQ